MSTRETRRTVCNRDCPDACRLEVQVVDGLPVAIAGDRQDPVTRGFICERTRRFLLRQSAADRFSGPMFRRDGHLEPISWTAALDLAAEPLDKVKKEEGAAAVLHYRSGGSLGILKAIPDCFFSLWGPVSSKTGDICSGAGERAQVLDFGISESHDLADLLNSRLILLWGKNPHTSGVHLLPVLREARARGARIVGIEVRETKMKSLCDDFILIHPGGDFALAMGLASYLLGQRAEPADIAHWTEDFASFRELATSRSLDSWAVEAGVSGEVLTRLGQLLVRVNPASIQVGWGLARRAEGCAAVRALDALAAVSGNIGVPGGGVSFYYGRRSAFDSDFGLGPLPEPPRLLRETLLGRDILDARDPAIRAVWVTAGNPVTMLPESATVREALASRDFVVVVDSHPTDTTDVADLVLPTLTLLEDDDLLGAYGNHYLRASSPAVAPPVDARHELEIIQGLAERLGLGAVFAGPVLDWKNRAMGRLRAQGIDATRLETEAVINPFRSPVLFAGKVFPRSGKRMKLITRSPQARAAVSADFPLLLLAVSAPRAQSSQWAVDPRGEADQVTVNPACAAGFQAGERLMVESARAAIEATLRLDPRVPVGLAHMPKGGMLRDGCCPNILVTARETDQGGGAAYYDEPVRLRSLPDPASS